MSLEKSLLLLKHLITDPSRLDVAVEQLRSSESESCFPLSRHGVTDEIAAYERLSTQLDFPLIRLSDPKIKARVQQEMLWNRVDRSILLADNILPLWEEEGTLALGMANPFDHESLLSIQFALGVPIKPLLVPYSEIASFLKGIPSNEQDILTFLDDSDDSSYLELVAQAEETRDLNARSLDAPPIVRLANRLIADALERGASDIHLEPQQTKLIVRFRVDGVLHTALEIPRAIHPYLISRIKLISGMDIAERRRPQDGRIRVRKENMVADIRASCIPSSLGEKLVLRLLNQSSTLMSLSQLGMDATLQAQITEAIHRKGKLLLVTGPTGSGKTTTLYAALSLLNNGVQNIQTIEDPVEYRLAGTTQTQVNPVVGVTFASVLRSILRQDPDVIMIGEIRDEETAELALQAAQTGHLVLSTLHTNDAPSAIARLLNLKLDPFTLASSLEGIIAQRLVRRLCPACKVAEPTEQVTDTPTNWHAVGCPECSGIGYKGRVPIYSYLPVSEEIADLIIHNASMREIAEGAAQYGFRSIESAALTLVSKGETSFEEVHPYLPHELYSPATDSPPQNLEKNEDHVTILLIEDDPDTRTILKELLEQECYEVLEAANGRDALALVGTPNLSLVLCDLMMPVMNGRDFLVRAKTMANSKSVPVVFLTAKESEEDETLLLDLGAHDFVRKTSSKRILLSRIRSALQKSSS